MQGTAKSIEARFVSTFVVREKRARYVELLGKPRHRRKITARLDHHFDYDIEMASEVPNGVDVAALLRSRGAPATCHVMASQHALDGRDVPFDVAMDELFAEGFGYVVICDPERLALYQPEAPSEAVLLEVAGRRR